MLKLIKNLGTRQIKCGRIDSFGLFLCEACGKEVEKVLVAGRRNKTCGCKVKAPAHEIDRICMRCGRNYRQKSKGKIIETSRSHCPRCARYLRYFKKVQEFDRNAKLLLSAN